MREVWRMWRYSTMVVLTVLTAGLFTAILIPFKGIPLIPGVTELRPANVIPLVFGLLFICFPSKMPSNKFLVETLLTVPWRRLKPAAKFI